MKILSAKWVVTCDENNSIIEDGAVVFDEKIIEIDTLENIQNKYPNIQIEQYVIYFLDLIVQIIIIYIGCCMFYVNSMYIVYIENQHGYYF